jgi:hypothetical protein
MDGETAAQIKKTLVSQFPQGTLSEKWYTVDGTPAYALALLVEKLGMHLKITEVVFLKRTRFYTVSYSAPPERYDEYVRAFTDCLGSFKTSGGR